MLTPEGCALRRKRLWQEVPGSIEALVVSDPQSLIYLANYAPSTFVFRTSDAAAYLVMERERATLIADKMVKPYLDRAHVDEVVAPVWYDGRHAAPLRREHLRKTALAFLRSLNAENLCFDLGASAGLAESNSGNGIDQILRKQRRVKDPDEMALIRRSIEAGEAGHKAALEGAKPGMTELEVYLLVQNAAIAEVGEQVIVYGDFASGARCETERGGPPTGRKIEAGDLFLLDYSVVVQGYRGDFTNTFVVGGKPSGGQRGLFEACMEGLALGESALRAGALAKLVDGAVRGFFEGRGLGKAYPSHTGHGLGLSHPEPPYFVPESDEVVMEGDVVAIEPGLFMPEVGGMRFERNYRVTAEGFETLTHHRLTLEP